MKRCLWCGEHEDSHERCELDMKSKHVRLLWPQSLVLEEERLEIQLKDKDIGKQIYEKYKNRDLIKMTQGQILNKELNIYPNLPKEI